jgi:hypothetical protein
VGSLAASVIPFEVVGIGPGAGAGAGAGLSIGDVERVPMSTSFSAADFLLCDFLGEAPFLDEDSETDRAVAGICTNERYTSFSRGAAGGGAFVLWWVWPLAAPCPS